jgi:ABC-type phosphate transport system substrate-binding protein
MKPGNAKILLALAVGIACWGMNEDQSVRAQETEVLVMVVNKTNNSVAGMNVGEARKLVLGETTSWHNGAQVLVVMTPAGSGERATVLKKICGMSEAAYTRYEMRAAFTGQTAAMVHDAASDAAVKSLVKANPGAVGFLQKSQVDDSVQGVLELN